MKGELICRDLGLVDYQDSWERMKTFTQSRDSRQADEIWLLQHPRVFTQGQAGKAEHLLAPGDIPVIPVDRGGQVTYHGPGQLIAYVLIDLKRSKLGVRELVTVLENTVIQTLRENLIESYAKVNAPGVYVDEKKISSLGLRVRRGCSFHGLALNVDMDLSPFNRINPCGYQGLEMTDMVRLNPNVTYQNVVIQLANQLSELLGHEHPTIQKGWN